MSKYFDIERFCNAIGMILPYLRITLLVVIIVLFFSTILAILLAILRIRSFPVISQLLGLYVSYMRGTPVLVQLFILYYGLPLLVKSLFGININRVDAIYFAEIALIMNETAFLSENFRSSILAVPALQTEASYSIGMTRSQTLRRIVLPQAIRIIIPTYGTTIVSIFQSTSLIYTLGVLDIMGRAQTIAAATSHSFEAYAVVALIYIIGSVLIRFVFRIIEKHMSYGTGIQND